MYTMWLKILVFWGIIVFLPCWVACNCKTSTNHPCTISDVLNKKEPLLIVEDAYTGVIQFIANESCPLYSQGCENNPGNPNKGDNRENKNGTCILSLSALDNSTDKTDGILMQKDNEVYYIYLYKRHFTKQDGLPLCFLPKSHQTTNPADIAAMKGESVCKGHLRYNESACHKWNDSTVIVSIDITTKKGNRPCSYETECVTCQNPIQEISTVLEVNTTTIVSPTGSINAAAASEFMKDLSSLLTKLGNESTAVINLGPAKGVLKRQKSEDAEFQEIVFGLSSDLNIKIVGNKADAEEMFPGSVSISKEAFDKANTSFKDGPFAAVFRFPNMSKDENNSKVFNNEVIAIEMGTTILNLTDTINITFRVKDNITMLCSSWDGSGDRPVWTTDGCDTIVNDGTVTCQCTHLTFFAILMTSPGTNISSSDLKSLSYITYIGCGLSMFFLGVALFMHFVLRRAKSSNATQILMNLFLAMFLLNLTFLSNEVIAGMGNMIGCKIIAALLHYSMLSTFTWFAVEAFHLCFHLVKSFNIAIRHYILKVCIAGWALPCVVVVIIFILGKYGNVPIHSDNEKTVNMCWITDTMVHYVVNIGYYALVFLFTFTVFIIIVRSLMFLRATDMKASQKGTGPKNIYSIMGLCCLLGVTWGFAFFSYGPLQTPSYYIFTILNSFQGFFLFLYYYNTSKVIGEEKTSSFSSKSTSTLKSTVDSQNPYVK